MPAIRSVVREDGEDSKASSSPAPVWNLKRLRLFETLLLFWNTERLCSLGGPCFLTRSMSLPRWPAPWRNSISGQRVFLSAPYFLGKNS